MRTMALIGLVALLIACAHAQRRSPAEREPGELTFHVLGLQKTPSGAT